MATITSTLRCVELIGTGGYRDDYLHAPAPANLSMVSMVLRKCSMVSSKLMTRRQNRSGSFSSTGQPRMCVDVDVVLLVVPDLGEAERDHDDAAILDCGHRAANRFAPFLDDLVGRRADARRQMVVDELSGDDFAEARFLVEREVRIHRPGDFLPDRGHAVIVQDARADLRKVFALEDIQGRDAVTPVEKLALDVAGKARADGENILAGNELERRVEVRLAIGSTRLTSPRTGRCVSPCLCCDGRVLLARISQRGACQAASWTA